MADEVPIVSFESPAEWVRWLGENHEVSPGIWLRMFKKATGKPSINYDEALDGALCFGWIDGQKKTYDEVSWIQKFTPRRPRSTWSKRNREHVERLIAGGQMQEAGRRQVELAKADGRWDNAYDSPKDMEIPADFLKALAKSKKAKRFFDSLNKTNLYAIAWRLQTAKRPETREKRMKAILQMMEDGKKLHG